jgi:hypothetical protein
MSFDFTSNQVTCDNTSSFPSTQLGQAFRDGGAFLFFHDLSDGSLLSKLLKAIVVLFALLQKSSRNKRTSKERLSNNPPYSRAKELLKRTDQ